jgi:diguanylate cyclase (GGDEF)-like protein
VNAGREARKERILGNAELFSELSEEDVRALAEHSGFRTYENGEPVFHAGEQSRALYIVDSGEVVVRKTNDDGLTTDIARYVRGNIFGELDLLTPAERAASAGAEGKTRLLEFPGPGRNFSDFLDAQPEVAARLMHRVLVETAERIRRVNQLVKENSPLVQELQKQVYRDKLTGLHNHVYLTERLRELLSEEGASFALCISKPDNFKLLNDNFGHEAGDRAIELMAGGLRDFVGDDTRTVRYKGNAMAVLLPGLDREEAIEEAHRIREFLNGLDLSEITGGDGFRLTASVGVSVYPGFEGSIDEMLRRTHELPLEGRNRGGNMILVAEGKSGAGD